MLFAGWSHGQAVTSMPKHATVSVGASVLLNCTLASPATIFKWVGYPRDLTPANEQLGKSIFQVRDGTPSGPQESARYAVEGQYNLRIKSTTLNDGGWYYCRVGNDPYKANVVVVGRCSTFYNF